ncbi:hypothetical protein CB1_001141002 [Camelus ferus]|nr:hypothetical protein CB1_001141002 [Camelus ferus]
MDSRTGPSLSTGSRDRACNQNGQSLCEAEADDKAEGNEEPSCCLSSNSEVLGPEKVKGPGAPRPVPRTRKALGAQKSGKERVPFGVPEGDLLCSALQTQTLPNLESQLTHSSSLWPPEQVTRVLIWAVDTSAYKILLMFVDVWSDHSFQTDPDLPPGWKRVNDIAGTYYWHIPTGMTQWERPVSIPADLQGSRKGSLSSVTPSPTPENEVIKDLHAATVNPDPSLKEFEGATLRYASLKLRNAPHADDDDSCSINSDPEAKCFAVRSLGWVEMAEEDLAPGKSSVAVNNCIRQLSYCKNDIRDTVGIWGEGKDMYLVLENDTLSLVDPMDRSVLHAQPIVSIRVWGVGRDNGRSANVTQGACKHCSALLLFLEHGPGCYTKSSKVHGLKSWR